MTNWNCGFKRSAIAWLVFWSAWGSWGWWRQSVASDHFIEVSRAKGALSEFAYWNDEMRAGASMLQTAFSCVLLPIAGLIVGAVAWWIWRGFRPRSKAG